MEKYLIVFADVINEYLALNGMSKNQFSQNIKVAERAVTKWLELEYYPTIDCVIKVADYFDCNIDCLFGLNTSQNFKRGVENARFIERFNYLCIEKKVSHYRIAKTCEFEQATISKWKNGKYPKTLTLIKLADFFNCSVDYLVGRSDSK